VPAKNVAKGLVRKFLSKIAKGSHDPAITPTRILFRHADYWLAELSFDPTPPGIGAVFRRIKLLRDQSSVHPRIVSGFTTHATCSNALRPSRSLIAASVDL
jgi:hypothetical protein